jgi:hypothetical protein
MQSAIQIDVLNIRLVVKLGAYSMSEFPFDIDGKADLHTIVKNGWFQRAYD